MKAAEIPRKITLNYNEQREIGIDTGKIIGRLMKLREEADYYPETPFSHEESLDMLQKANEFVNVIKNIVLSGI